ncbi:30S ribosome-binding factor RbfA [Halobacteriovorax sp. GB3]|uniref:30S ribosome-binding factor RbfA n=1 Tax=Halobacteriovorax sp. GB3 TaxID=2719615 RepID=UPI002361004B|nr:30S ribosome-binding factor RbfA [Halobacteriovorax sp. GB3]MDD0852708.1 30S ribosome-binding factor RbfA [Halobacteriovorax sp. GB3]
MAKKNFKKEKYTEKLVHELNGFLRREANDSRLTFVSITKVELTVDYTMAKVYWDTFDANKRGDAKKAIEGLGPRLRSHLAKTLKVRQVPELKFFYDSQYVDERYITDILESEAQEGRLASDEEDGEE